MPTPTDAAAIKSWIQEFVGDVSANDCIAVTLTMKQWTEGHRLDPIRASQNLRHFLNCVNARVLGTRFKRFGNRLKVFPVLESSSTGRLHYHLVMQKPCQYSFESENLIRNEWTKTHFGHDQIKVVSQANSGWLEYITKFRTASDSVDWENVHWD